VQTTYVFKLVCDLSIGAISNDLERTLTLFSRSGSRLIRPFFDAKYITNGYGYSVYAADARSVCDS